jgi:hypothetical protein
LPEGTSVRFELPFGLIEYLGNDVFKKARNEFAVKKIGMVAAGSGITPMLR